MNFHHQFCFQVSLQMNMYLMQTGQEMPIPLAETLEVKQEYILCAHNHC